jgi:hypothetical protein
MELTKMSKPTIRIHDILTEQIIDREMNDIEFAQYEKDQASESVKQLETELKATAKANLLKKLGINAEEAALLLS